MVWDLSDVYSEVIMNNISQTHIIALTVLQSVMTMIHKTPLLIYVCSLDVTSICALDRMRARKEAALD